MKTVIINYLRKSNLFKASKWVSRVLLRRRICTQLPSPPTLWASLVALIPAADSQPLLFWPGREDREHRPVLSWQLGHPRWQWGIRLLQPCSAHSQESWPSTAVWWQQVTVLCPLPCALSNLTGISQPPDRSEFFPNPAGIKLARGTCMSTCVHMRMGVPLCECVCAERCTWAHTPLPQQGSVLFQRHGEGQGAGPPDNGWPDPHVFWNLSLSFCPKTKHKRYKKAKTPSPLWATVCVWLRSQGHSWGRAL